MKVPLVGIAIVGLVCVTLGFVAERYRGKEDDLTISDGKCIYSRTPAYGLGWAAAVLLLVDQILISSLAGCICCNKVKPEGAKFCIGVTCYVVSCANWFAGVGSLLFAQFTWEKYGLLYNGMVMFVPALLYLLIGAISSASHATYYEEDYHYYRCPYTRRGSFSVAATLSLVTLSLGIIYYIIASSAPPASPVQNHGIAMAQPQMECSQPAFVPEDTYRRRQDP